MIYFDNAATGGFKASAVFDAAVTTLKYLNANPGRSGHRLALAGAKTVIGARMAVPGAVQRRGRRPRNLH